LVAGIVGVPQRAWMIEELRALVEPHVDSLVVYMDEERKGCLWNMHRAIQETAARARDGEAALVMTDDAITVPGWRDRYERIAQEVDAAAYCLFSRQRHVFKPENLARGYTYGVHRGGFYDLATVYIRQRTLIPRVRQWYATRGQFRKSVATRAHHPDILIQEYLVAHEIPWVVSAPSLFDHREGRSTIGHKIGRSPCYIGRLP